MIVKVTMEFDLDCEDEKEKYEIISDVLLDKDCCDEDEEEEVDEEEVEEEDEPDYENGFEVIADFVQDELDNAKAGTPTAKAYLKIKNRLEEIREEFNLN